MAAFGNRTERPARDANFAPVRRERRNGAVRIVEIAHRLGAAELGRREKQRAAEPTVRKGGFPRPPERLIGFTRDLSESGMCLGLDEAAPVGSLLDVTLCGLNGKPVRRVLGRVVWARPDFDTRVWHGLELLGPSPEGGTAPDGPSNAAPVGGA